MTYIPKHTDFSLSPFTGLTRDSWIDAGKYLLGGVFGNLTDKSMPLVMPRAETEVTYPHLRDPEKEQDRQRRAEIFEGLTRSFLIGSVLIHDDPKLTLADIPVTEYYRDHILRACTPGDTEYVGTYSGLKEMLGLSGFVFFQQTVETCALVIGLWACREEIWATYSAEEKQQIADLLMDYAIHDTVPQNWRLFNMLDLAFLAMEGYPIDERIMYDHAQAILSSYTGDGWYRDGHSFDYYSCWAFQFYAPLWNLWWGYDHAPELARAFEANSNTLMETYGRFMDRDGFINMWGRSNIYRNAATSAFDGNFLLKNPAADPGWSRRICSGALLQFLTRDDFLINGIPSLGFYGQFTPLVQGYSCAESPFWLGKAFLALHLPKEHPFWTARENEGDWAKLKKGEVLETVLNGPALCITNHEATGETILRTGKVMKQPGDRHGMWNYAKLCFHTKYPWEASPVENGKQREDVESRQYVLHDLTSGTYSRGNAVLWGGEKQGVLYRRLFFDYDIKTEEHWIQALNLADLPVRNGILRADRIRLPIRPVEFTLGSFGFPDNGTRVEHRTNDGAKAILLYGRDHTGQERKLAMTVYTGWEELDLIRSRGTNPDSEYSLIIFAKMSLCHQYDASEPYVLVSQVITGEDHIPFTDEEVFPLKELCFHDRYGTGAYGPVELLFRDGVKKIIDYDGIEGSLSL